MHVAIRDYGPEDDSGILEVFRDSNNSLKQSQGGIHADEQVDRLVSKPDRELLSWILFGSEILVAESDGRILGFTGFLNRPIDRLLKSAYGTSTYVRKDYQRGRAGVAIGSMLVNRRKEKLINLGFRKLYSYSVPESVRFHEKQGARFYPLHDTYSLNSRLQMRYFEIILKKSFWNRIRIEPFLFETRSIYGKILKNIRKGAERG